ncbi:polypeptide N-acetylgalactosaminyltransferase 13-like [Ruditapes philippinarum]|uniref:polypeptide N-acetylgalactosaminyltransferase 13-like n=1 Tax=Ruditapes philippinarum TaxID=129788 RepID=UPI00295AF922|nr:polypeptide N-acetylgalactosaminyltransferase 13-like [Ruditapes philippinarum]
MGPKVSCNFSVLFCIISAIFLIYGISRIYQNHQVRRERNFPEQNVKKLTVENTSPSVKQQEIVTELSTYLGPGADGEQIYLPANREHYEYIRNKSLLHEVNNFNSDLVGLKRILPDQRPEKCKDIQYPSDLPEVSIVITFREESVPSLLRTVYSVLETSPDRLIKEVILVDDGSKDEFLKAAVEIHATNVDKIKLLRNEQALGLMRARQRGIEETGSDYFIVLDGHIEVTPGWLEPVLYRLVQEPNALLTSHIMVLNKETFEISRGDHDIAFMFFDQITLNELWVKYTNDYRAYRNGSVSPIPYGIVPGMMTAMRKSFFLQLGGFDPGMEIWGVEHMELSVKTWLCGGVVEMLPCSKIGHIYRAAPWQSFHPHQRYVSKNMMRFAHVWMDGYLQKLALRVQHKSNLSHWPDPGDLEDRHKIRRENNCKPYQYYVDKIQNMTHNYVPKSPRVTGVVRNEQTKACLDHATIGGNFVLITYSCTGDSNQFFVLTEDNNIRVERSWLLVIPGSTKLKLLRDITDWSGPEFLWTFENNSTIKHTVTGKCLTENVRQNVTLEDCVNSRSQMWKWPLTA